MLYFISGNKRVVSRSARTNELLSLSILFLLFFLNTSIAHAFTATLSWSANTEADLLGYRLYYGSASGNYEASIDIGNQTSYTLAGLGAGTYYFAITAYDTAMNESGPSLERKKMFLELDGTPPVLSGVTAGSINSAGATITWFTDEGAMSRVEYSLDSSYGFSSQTNPAFTATHEQFLSGLSPSSTYNYRVISIDAAGNIGTSGNFVFTTTAEPGALPPGTLPPEALPPGALPPGALPPGAVLNLVASEKNGQIQLLWENPLDLGFAGARIVSREDGFPSDINDGEVLGDYSGNPGAEMSAMHPGLQNGLTYYYLVASYDKQGIFRKKTFVSGTPRPEAFESTSGEERSGGGCGMIRPGGGNPPGPGQAAGMLSLLGIFALIWLKKGLRRCRFGANIVAA